METALVKQSESAAVLEPLNDQEQAALTTCEATIERGFQSFIEVGRALATIRDSRLYRASHRTFQDYCRARWGVGRAHASRYIDASRVAEILSPIGDTPVKESQIRPLTRVRKADGSLDDKVIVKLWDRAVERASTDF